MSITPHFSISCCDGEIQLFQPKEIKSSQCTRTADWSSTEVKVKKVMVLDQRVLCHHSASFTIWGKERVKMKGNAILILDEMSGFYERIQYMGSL